MAVIHEVAFRRDAKIIRGDVEFLDGKQLGKFGLRPAIEFAFVTFAVGVLGGLKSAAGMRQVAQNVIQNIAGGGGVKRLRRRDEPQRFPGG